MILNKTIVFRLLINSTGFKFMMKCINGASLPVLLLIIIGTIDDYLLLFIFLVLRQNIAFFVSKKLQ
jgi:hypothetical protein